MTVGGLFCTVLWCLSIGALLYHTLTIAADSGTLFRSRCWSLLVGCGLLALGTLSVFGALLVILLVLITLHFRKRWRKKRRQDIERELPQLVDFITFYVEAGNSVYHSLIQAKKILDPEKPLIEEVHQLEKNVHLGIFGQAEAVLEMGRNLPISSGENPLTAVSRAIENGTPVIETLRRQSEQMRYKMLMDGESRANVLAIKLLLPLVVFIFPASFLVILSPVITGILENAVK